MRSLCISAPALTSVRCHSDDFATCLGLIAFRLSGWLAIGRLPPILSGPSATTVSGQIAPNSRLPLRAGPRRAAPRGHKQQGSTKQVAPSRSAALQDLKLPRNRQVRCGASSKLHVCGSAAALWRCACPTRSKDGVGGHRHRLHPLPRSQSISHRPAHHGTICTCERRAQASGWSRHAPKVRWFGQWPRRAPRPGSGKRCVKTSVIVIAYVRIILPPRGRPRRGAAPPSPAAVMQQPAVARSLAAAAHGRAAARPGSDAAVQWSRLCSWTALGAVVKSNGGRSSVSPSPTDQDHQPPGLSSGGEGGDASGWHRPHHRTAWWWGVMEGATRPLRAR